MKKIFLIVLVCSIIGSCGKENTVVSENKKETKEETFICECTYENICIDTIQWRNAKLEDILGEWEVEAFIDTVDYTITQVSEKTEMRIFFQKDNVVTGHTVSNTFNGNFDFEREKIVFSDIEITEIMEPEIGKVLSQALLEENNVFFMKERLIFSSQHIIIFSKL